MTKSGIKIALSLFLLAIYNPVIANQFDLAIVSLDIPKYNTISNSPFSIAGLLTNLGTDTINNFELNYSVDDGPIQTTSISSISFGTSDTLLYSSSIPWVPSNLGIYSVRVWASSLNGNADQNTINDTILRVIHIVDTLLQRSALHEVFTSSTCPPGNPGNINLHNVWDNSTQNPVFIKYQMAWPGSGDPYYTSEGGLRRMFYGTNQIPWVEIDGAWHYNANWYADSVLNRFSNIPAFLELGGNYTVSGQNIDITLALRPLSHLLDSNVLYLGIVEKETFNNARTNGQTVFYNVMKKMLPDGNGLYLGPVLGGMPITFNYNYSFNGSYRLPNSAGDAIDHSIEHSVEEFNDLAVVIWLQNKTNKEVFQAAYAIEQNTPLDAGLLSLNIPDSVGTGANIAISGSLQNNQNSAITSYDLVYRINGANENRETINTNISNGNTETFNHSISWTPSTPGFYKVEVMIDNINGSGIGNGDDLAINNKGFIYVHVVNGYNQLIPSHEIAKSISIFPNPSSDFVQIETHSDMIKNVEIFNLNGAKYDSILLDKKGVYSVKTLNYPKGTYILKFNTINGSFSERLLIY